jgi:hypothetical protein
MADHRALGRLGWAFGAVTAAVLLMAVLIVATNVDKRPGVGAPQVMASAAVSLSIR